MTTDTDTKNTIREGGQVLVCFEDEATYLIEIARGRKLSVHCGRPVPHDALIGRFYGDWLECENGRALLLEPTTEDLIMKARRESGIIYPKDAAVLMMKLGIRSGSRVIEIGMGSGALTLALARQVAPEGRVYSYEVREDFLKLAEENLRKAGALSSAQLHLRKPDTSFEEREVDAVVSDVPEPWREVEFIQESLKNGGRLATLNPTFNQIERTAEALRSSGFLMIEAMEVLVRGILARAGKTRPEQRMVSHTEFLLFAVKPSRGLKEEDGGVH